ncbi:ABC transporter permease, partial [Runella sp.]|uniref:ABC transporter permease n=1 Tax=Runella sp. TaxID=1960881 RepID=UPI0030180BAF
MYFYFQLQFRIINRKLTEFGLRPVLGYILAAIAFVLVSVFLFYKTVYAQYIYAALALSFISKLSEQNRNYFLKSTFKTDTYLRVRLLENLIVAIPFVVYLLFAACFMVAGVLFLASILLGFIRFEDKLNFTIPTPFYRYPFEFTIGFRKSVLLYGLACFLAYKAIDVVNFYLGAFSVGLVILLGVSHYISPENEYFVWIYAANPKSFLRKKIGTALLYSSILSI